MNNNSIIGSVVEYMNNKLLVIGVSFFNENNLFTKIYYTLPFPRGFVDEDSVRVVKAEDVTLIRKGPEVGISESFSKYIEMMDQLSSTASANDIESALNSLASKEVALNG